MIIKLLLNIYDTILSFLAVVIGTHAHGNSFVNIDFFPTQEFINIP